MKSKLFSESYKNYVSAQSSDGQEILQTIDLSSGSGENSSVLAAGTCTCSCSCVCGCSCANFKEITE